MAWNVYGQVSVPNPDTTPWVGLPLPGGTSVVAWAVAYVAAQAYPENWSRIGFYGEVVTISGRVIGLPPKVLSTVYPNSTDPLHLLDYSVLLTPTGFPQRITAFSVVFHPVAYAPPGEFVLYGLT